MMDELRQRLARAAAANDVAELLAAGASALQSGLDEQAIEPVRHGLSSNPGQAQLWHLLGLLHRNLDEMAAAVEALRRAEALAPADAAIVNAHACSRYEAGFSAVANFERLRLLTPTDRGVILRLAAAQIAEGLTAAAIANLADELARTPGWLPGHVALARVRWASGDRDGFAASLERAVAILPREVAVWQTYLGLLVRDQLHERALAVVERARRCAGDQRAFDAAEAIARTELGELEAAGSLFARIGNIGEPSLIVHQLRFLLRSGRVDEATAIAASRAASDRSHQLWPYLGLCWRLTGDERWRWLDGDNACIGVYDMADRLPSIDALAACLRKLHRTQGDPLDQSLRGGTQTEGHLFSRAEPEIRALRAAIVEAVDHHAARLPSFEADHPLWMEKRGPVRFAGSWSVRLAAGGRHVVHCHPAGWMSSAFYVALPEQHERGAPDAGSLDLGGFNDMGLDVPPVRTIEPRPGRLVLFPSIMWHGTRPFAQGERLTVAFDVRRPS